MKYKKKFTKFLMNGCRREGMSIEELCQIWGISRSTYYNWCAAHPKFAEADEIGNRDALAWLHKLNRQVMSGEVKGNAGTIIFAMKNLAGWKDKSEVSTTVSEEIRTININVLPPKISTEALEQQTIKVIEHDNT